MTLDELPASNLVFTTANPTELAKWLHVLLRGKDVTHIHLVSGASVTTRYVAAFDGINVETRLQRPLNVRMGARTLFQMLVTEPVTLPERPASDALMAYEICRCLDDSAAAVLRAAWVQRKRVHLLQRSTLVDYQL